MTTTVWFILRAAAAAARAGLAAALVAALAAGPAAAFGTPTALVRAIYRPLLEGQPVSAPESMLYEADTYRRLQAWRGVQPPGLGFSPFTVGPYITPQGVGGRDAVTLNVGGRPVEFQIIEDRGGVLPALAAGAAPAAPLSRFSARQIHLDALGAEVSVSFTAAGAPTELLYDLVREADGWRIRDIRSIGPGIAWSLRGVIGAGE